MNGEKKGEREAEMDRERNIESNRAPPKIHIHPDPQNMALFRDRVFESLQL